MSKKYCRDCKQVKSTRNFHANSASRDGLAFYCKPCALERRRCHNAKGKAAYLRLFGGTRHYHLLRRYGITASQVEAMIEAQGGLCAICRRKPAEHVDHSHASGAVREILCFNCNGGLGQFGDDPGVLEAADDYLRRHRTADGQAGEWLAQLGIGPASQAVPTQEWRRVCPGVWLAVA